jgi:DNA-binding MarR family transcriptional regulator
MVDLVRQDVPDLSAHQLAVLLSCYLDDGRQTVGGLTERLGVSKPAVTRALDRLEQLTLAKRVPSQRDRRTVLVVATGPGFEFMGRLRTVIEKVTECPGISPPESRMEEAAR